VQLDTDYMMELLEPTQLQGEGEAGRRTNTNTPSILEMIRVEFEVI